MAKRTTGDMRKWALIGAEQRLVELAQEIAAIHNAFPELRQGRRGRPAKEPSSSTAADAPKRRRRRRKLSAEARKRISDAQKARWAKQRGQKK